MTGFLSYDTKSNLWHQLTDLNTFWENKRFIHLLMTLERWGHTGLLSAPWQRLGDRGMQQTSNYWSQSGNDRISTITLLKRKRWFWTSKPISTTFTSISIVFEDVLFLVCVSLNTSWKEGRKEGNVLFNDTLKNKPFHAFTFFWHPIANLVFVLGCR